MKPQLPPIPSPSATPRQHQVALPHPATPIAATNSQQLPGLPKSFYACPEQEAAPDLIDCLLLKLQPTGEFLLGVIAETEAYYLSEHISIESPLSGTRLQCVLEEQMDQGWQQNAKHFVDALAKKCISRAQQRRGLLWGWK